MASQKTETYSVNFWKTNGLFLVKRGLSLGYNLENKEGEQNKLPRIVIINMCIWDNDMSIFTSDYVAFLSPTQLFLDKYMVHLESHHIQNGWDCEIILWPTVQFRKFKFPIGIHWKDNKHFYKGLFFLNWSGRQINNRKKANGKRRGQNDCFKSIVETPDNFKWVSTFSQYLWGQIFSQLVILKLFILGVMVGLCLVLKIYRHFHLASVSKAAILGNKIINTLVLLITTLMMSALMLLAVHEFF